MARCLKTCASEAWSETSVLYVIPSCIAGFCARINEKEQDQIDAGNYRGTTYIGKIGLEKYYESDLHGMVGQQNVEVNAEGRILRAVDRMPPTPGKNLILSLDMELQKLAEEAMGDYSGAVIAMIPQTGEVLVFVSTPMYDPNLFVHGISFQEYENLKTADDKPLFNKALYGQYPPGSTYKPFIALAALESAMIDFGKKKCTARDIMNYRMTMSASTGTGKKKAINTPIWAKR